MKNVKKILAGLIVTLFAILCLAPGEMKAQPCPSVRNMLTCPVKIIVNLYRTLPGGACQTTPCFSYAATVPAGATIPTNCNACSGVCRIEVVVTDIGGIAIAPVAADNTTIPGPNALPGNCGSNNIQYNPGPPMQFVIN